MLRIAGRRLAALSSRPCPAASFSLLSRAAPAPDSGSPPPASFLGAIREIAAIVRVAVPAAKARMGGLGKTTLANKLYRAPDVRKHFDLRLWLKVTAHGFVPLKIANAMIEAATRQGFQHYEKDTLESNLRKLIGAKRYLLVLDDVWNESSQHWDELKDLLTFGAHGSCVLATTRSQRVTSLMVSSLDQEYMLKGLCEDDCWELFKRRAFRGGEERPNLVNIGRAIVKKCDGLPLAVKEIGRLMPGMTEEDWNAVLKSEIWDREFEGSGILPALMLSYSKLPSDVNQCFAFCSIFPKGHEIKKESLIRICTVNGYLASQTDQSSHCG